MTMRIGCWQRDLRPLPARLQRGDGARIRSHCRADRIGMLAGLKALGAGNSGSWSSTSNKITNAMKDRAP